MLACCITSEHLCVKGYNVYMRMLRFGENLTFLFGFLCAFISKMNIVTLKKNQVFSLKAGKIINLINFQKVFSTGGKCFRYLNESMF